MLVFPSPLSTAEWSALLLLATASSFTPGPNTALSAALGANRGWRSAMAFISAVPLGCGLIFTLCALGVGGLLHQFPALRSALLLSGGGYLVWLASKLWRSRQMRNAQAGDLSIGFGQGVLLQFLNIKVWMLELSFVAGWLAGQDAFWPRFASILPVVLVFALTSNLTYAWLGSALRHWLAQGERLLVFNRVMATALTLTAVWMLRGLT